MGVTIAEKQKKLNYYYSVNCKAYDDIMLYHYGEFRRNHLIKKMNINYNEKILDLATGTGLNIKHMPKKASIYAIDINSDMINQIHKRRSTRKKNPKLTQGDIRNLPFKDSSFDHSLITYGLSGSFNTNMTLKEIIRVTKPEGQIGILDFTYSNAVPEYGFGAYWNNGLEKEIEKIKKQIEITFIKAPFYVKSGGLEQTAYILRVKK